jgi:hypothetical protein
MRFVLLIISLAAGAACRDAPAAPSGPVDELVTLAPGQTAPVPGTSIQLRFIGVSGDSRCPADALCIQGGDAIVQVDVIPAAGSTSRYELHTGSLEPVHHGSYVISLVELSPYPFSGRPIAPGEYRVKLRVVRR